jgi:uncharacterized protein (DUF58 family)
MYKLLWLSTLLLALALPAGALATSGTATGPGLSVTVSLSPDTAPNGDTVTANESVTNTSSTKQSVVITNALADPTGGTVTRTKRVVLKPGEAFTQTATYVVDPADARGTYTLSVTASAQSGTATASAQVTYV